MKNMQKCNSKNNSIKFKIYVTINQNLKIITDQLHLIILDNDWIRLGQDRSIMTHWHIQDGCLSLPFLSEILPGAGPDDGE